MFYFFNYDPMKKGNGIKLGSIKESVAGISDGNKMSPSNIILSILR